MLRFLTLRIENKKSMSRRSSLLTQIQNKPVHTSQTKKWNTNNSLSIDQEIEYPAVMT